MSNQTVTHPLTQQTKRERTQRGRLLGDQEEEKKKYSDTDFDPEEETKKKKEKRGAAVRVTRAHENVAADQRRMYQSEKHTEMKNYLM